MLDATDAAEQLDKHLNSPKQTWLLSAGVSFTSNIPLMYPLTAKTFQLANDINFSDNERAKLVIEHARGDMKDGSHIEHVLTHLADLISIAERSRTGAATLGGEEFTKVELRNVHTELLGIIAEIVRWGYKPEEGTEPERIGERGKSIVTATAHQQFIQAIFKTGRAGIDFLRTPVEFFTTNYDTLLEDALALQDIIYCDGFVGGGVAFWDSSTYGSKNHARAIVSKLHGSIDWYKPSRASPRLLRVRNGDSYPSEGGTVMIYPQASKYLTAQHDPFSILFNRFRARLTQGTDQVLLICGYSFGDEHINAEVEAAMSKPGNQLTIVAFSFEGDEGLPDSLEEWRNNPNWGERVFVVSPKGLYCGSSSVMFAPADGQRDWWTFDGVVNLISNGLPADIQDEIQ